VSSILRARQTSCGFPSSIRWRWPQCRRFGAENFAITLAEAVHGHLTAPSSAEPRGDFDIRSTERLAFGEGGLQCSIAFLAVTGYSPQAAEDLFEERQSPAALEDFLRR